jgi:thermitase
LLADASAIQGAAARAMQENMKHHVVVKLHWPVAEDLRIPDWLTFIDDKSVVRDTIEPGIDRTMRDLGLKFWATREYQPAGDRWSPEEAREGLDRTYRLILQEDYALPPDLVARIKRLPAVADAHALEVAASRLPVPQVSTQASLASRASDAIYLSYAKALTKGHPEIRIAVVDTGVNLDHQELRGKVVAGADFVDLQGLDTSSFIGDTTDYDSVPEDEVGHGTHVSGIIAGRGIEMDEGVAPDCSIVAVRVLATMRSGSKLYGAGIVDNINPGIKWAVDVGKADVINMSLGIKHESGALPHADIIRYAIGKGVTVVAASGNDGKPERYYPGALPGVIAVGAVDDAGNVTPFTSYGANICCVAPGTNIYSSFAHNTYAFASGTSQASPFVAGGIALMKSLARDQGTTLTNAEVTTIIKKTSDKVDSRLRDEHAGYGLLNLADAFKLLTHSMDRRT